MPVDSDRLSKINIQIFSEIERENYVSGSISGRNPATDSFNTFSSPTVNQIIYSDVSFQLNNSFSESSSSASLSSNGSNDSDINVSYSADKSKFSQIE